MSQTLSVCMIVRDEADCLVRCLASVSPVASEIVVVDTGSLDATPAIAAAHGARVLDYAWHQDFAAARNFSLDQARGDWILVIDADEWLPLPSQQQLRQFLGSAPEPACIRLRVDCPDPQGRITLAYSLLRLFPNLPRFRFKRAFHEFLCDEGEPPLPKIYRSDLVLLHSGLQFSVAAAKGKKARNRELIDSLRRAEPDNPSWLYYSAQEWRSAGEQAKALDEFLQLISQQRYRDEPMYQRAVIEAMSCCRELARLRMGLELAKTFESLCSRYPDYWFVRGTLHRRRRRELGAAQACFETCLSFHGREAELDCPYNPQALGIAPLAQLLQIHRSQLHHPEHDLDQRRFAWRQLHATLARALRLEPGPGWLRYVLEAGMTAQALGLGHATAVCRELLPPDPAAQTLLGLFERLLGGGLLRPEGAPVEALHQLESAVRQTRTEAQAEIVAALLHACLLLWRESNWVQLEARYWHSLNEAEKAQKVLSEALLVMPWDVELQAAVQAEIDRSAQV
ncbi:MAG: glycosyltransferase family 2 protein [Candidatus Sericytochromatia bacterium]